MSAFTAKRRELIRRLFFETSNHQNDKQTAGARADWIPPHSGYRHRHHGRKKEPERRQSND